MRRKRERGQRTSKTTETRRRVSSRLTPRPKTHLHMHRTSTNMANQQISHHLLPTLQPTQNSIPKPTPEHGDPSNLEPPPSVPLSCEGFLDQEAVRVGVEVEASESEDGVVRSMLVGDHEAGEGVEGFDVVVVG